MQSQVQASGQGLNDVVGNLPGVRRELTEGIGSLLGWRKGVCRKKTETRQKIVGGSRKAYRDFGRIAKVKGITFLGFLMAEPPVSDGCTIVAQDFEQLSVAELPRLNS
ncbi:hypothetical protein BHM03_00038174 [Ensete ventricosum]|nr:hypothetical protein BHM03_00038174 [Ensete ventricosum]